MERKSFPEPGRQERSRRVPAGDDRPEDEAPLATESASACPSRLPVPGQQVLSCRSCASQGDFAAIAEGWGARIRTWDRGSKVRCLTAWPHPSVFYKPCPPALMYSILCSVACQDQMLGGNSARLL